MTIEGNRNLDYLIEQIRSNLLTSNENEMIKETPKALAWLLTTLAIYGNDFQVLLISIDYFENKILINYYYLSLIIFYNIIKMRSKRIIIYNKNFN